MDRRIFVLFFGSQVLLMLVFLLLWYLSNRQFRAIAFDNETKIEERISKIVVSTLIKVKEDVGIITNENKSQVKKDGEDKKTEIKIEGARLSTFEDHFYIDNVPFFKGDVIAPYGIATLIGRDLVVFDDLNGGLVFLGKELPSPEGDKKSEDEKKVDKDLKI